MPIRPKERNDAMKADAPAVEAVAAAPDAPLEPTVEEAAAVPVAVDPIAQARMVLAAHEQRQRDACAAELAEVLGRHGFDLRVTPAQIVLAPRSGTT